MANYLLPTDKAHHIKTLQTSTGNSYTYLSIPPSSPEKPTLLFLHGFPSSSYDWRQQVAHFSSPSLGYGLIVPDLLGYGQTSRPMDPAAYTGKKMATEICEILATEGYGPDGKEGKGIKKVHGIGHDWGCFLLSRLANWFPERLESAAFLSVAYLPPGSTNVNWLDELNGMTKKMMGWEVLGYWKFFEREDAGRIVDEHVSFLF
jgi:soluble epoxide hydrolase / lipid-phosphate phosphatase